MLDAEDGYDLDLYILENYDGSDDIITSRFSVDNTRMLFMNHDIDSEEDFGHFVLTDLYFNILVQLEPNYEAMTATLAGPNNFAVSGFNTIAFYNNTGIEKWT